MFSTPWACACPISSASIAATISPVRSLMFPSRTQWSRLSLRAPALSIGAAIRRAIPRGIKRDHGGKGSGMTELGALVPHSKIRVEGAKSGPLGGLTFMAKDLFDVAGHRTGAGNPDWLATHPAAR